MDNIITNIKALIVEYLSTSQDNDDDDLFFNTATEVFYIGDVMTAVFVNNVFLTDSTDETHNTYLTQLKNKINETDLIMILNYNWNHYRTHYAADYQIVLPIIKEYIVKEFMSIWAINNHECIRELMQDYIIIKKLKQLGLDK
jgi:hypothetical protein